jgi:hypothetical protein
MVDGTIHRLLKIMFLLCCSVMTAFSYDLKTSVDRNSFTLGDPIHFRVMMELPKDVQCVPPEPEKLFGNLTVKEWNISRSPKDPKDSVFVDYILTSYIPENCTIPSIPFVMQSPASTDTVFTETHTMQFMSVITPPAAGSNDTNIDIKDLKPQQLAGNPPKFWLWITIILGSVAILAAIALYLSKKFKKKEIVPPPVPPYEEAIMALGVLHGKRLLEKGLIREYVFELSEIFKRYIERRFSTNASEFTTEEMIAWAGASGLDKKLKSSLEWFFKATDPVKFARIIPDSVTVSRFSDEVTNFLEATRPLPQITESNNQDVPTVSDTPQQPDSSVQLSSAGTSVTTNEVGK